MYPPSMQGPARNRNATYDSTRRFSDLYFGYASNLSPQTLKGRCPDSLFAGLAVLKDFRWHINTEQYGNIVASPGDHVYGALFFMSPRDEAGLDESEGVPWMYEKQWHEVERIDEEGKGTGQVVTSYTYVDVKRLEDGVIMPDYVVWINKAIRDATPYGLPAEYVEKYMRKFIPKATDAEEERREIEAVRVMFPRPSADLTTSMGR